MEKTKKQLIKDIEELQKKVDNFEDSYETLKLGKKEFRIYKWEDKKIGDFKYKKNEVLAEYSEFIELFDKKLIDYPKEDYVEYFTKHQSIRKQKENILSGCYFNRSSYLSSISSDLSSSDDSGRVVVRVIK